MCMYAFPVNISLYVNTLRHIAIMFPIWLATVIIFYIVVWLLIVKTDKHLLLL